MRCDEFLKCYLPVIAVAASAVRAGSQGYWVYAENLTGSHHLEFDDNFSKDVVFDRCMCNTHLFKREAMRIKKRPEPSLFHELRSRCEDMQIRRFWPWSAPTSEHRWTMWRWGQSGPNPSPSSFPVNREFNREFGRISPAETNEPSV